MNPRVVKVIPSSDYTSTITFDDGQIRRFDTKPYLDIGIYQELKDLHVFNSVHSFLGSIQWKNGLDFDLDTLYSDSMPVKRNAKVGA